jgi:hypothetical protein
MVTRVTCTVTCIIASIWRSLVGRNKRSVSMFARENQGIILEKAKHGEFIGLKILAELSWSGLEVHQIAF